MNKLLKNSVFKMRTVFIFSTFYVLSSLMTKVSPFGILSTFYRAVSFVKLIFN